MEFLKFIFSWKDKNLDIIIVWVLPQEFPSLDRQQNNFH